MRRWCIGILAIMSVASIGSVSYVHGQGAININEASAEKLQELHGIGDTYAQRIITYRNEQDGFASVGELTNVNGIGDKTLADIRDRVVVSGGTDNADEDDDESATSSSADESDENTENDSRPSQIMRPEKIEEVEETPTAEEAELSLSIDRTPANPVARAPVTFTAIGRTDGSESHAATYTWNFGDGTVADGKEVVHTYPRAGTYVVVLSAETLEQQRRLRKTVTVNEPALSIIAASTSPSGMVTIKNRLDKRINLGDWQLQSAGTSFTLPDRTYVAPNARITVTDRVADIPIAYSGIALRTPTGKTVDRYDFRESGNTTDQSRRHAQRDRRSRSVAVTSATDNSTGRSGKEAASAPQDADNAVSEAADDAPSRSTETSSRAATSQQAAVLGTSDSGMWPWLVALAGVVALAVLSALLFWPEAGIVSASNTSPAYADEEAQQYTIRDISHSS